MKQLPLILLALMAALFAVTLHRPEAWAGWVNAFAEAGMVGALADWFAVTALFRHPMGIPIPHTAIIPRRKDEIGDNLAGFVAEHFLHPDVVRAKLETVNLAAAGSAWLRSDRGQQRVADLGTRSLRWLLGVLSEERVRRFINRIGGRQLQNLDLSPMLGKAMDLLVQDGRHQQVLTQALRYALVLVHENRELIRGNVQRESPWWLPGFVDDRIVVQMLDRIETLLLEMSLDPDHTMRSRFDDWANQAAHDLQHSPEYRRWGEQVRKSLAENAELQDYLFRLWADFSNGLQTDLEDPDSAVRAQLQRMVAGLAEELKKDADMQAWVNQRLIEATVGLVDENRESIASLISDTVRSWDAKDTSERVEAAIGRDLQFIRINGTLVGGLVGLVIHAVKLI